MIPPDVLYKEKRWGWGKGCWTLKKTVDLELLPHTQPEFFSGEPRSNLVGSSGYINDTSFEQEVGVGYIRRYLTICR